MSTTPSATTSEAVASWIGSAIRRKPADRRAALDEPPGVDQQQADAREHDRHPEAEPEDQHEAVGHATGGDRAEQQDQRRRGRHEPAGQPEGEQAAPRDPVGGSVAGPWRVAGCGVAVLVVLVAVLVVVRRASACVVAVVHAHARVRGRACRMSPARAGRATTAATHRSRRRAPPDDDAEDRVQALGRQERSMPTSVIAGEGQHAERVRDGDGEPETDRLPARAARRPRGRRP